MLGFVLRLLYNLLLFPLALILFVLRKLILLRKPRMLELSLKSLPELSPSSLPFGERTMLDDLANQMTLAAQHKKISGLLIHLDGVDGSLAEMADLTAQVAKFREAGKPVFVHLENADNPTYLVGCVASRLSVSRGGPILVHSLGSEARYFGDALHKIGVQMQVVRRRDHKTAMEPFQRNAPSPEQTETVHRLMTSVQKTYVEVMAAGRGIDQDAAQVLLDSGPFTLKQALENKVIDAVETKEAATVALLTALQPPLPADGKAAAGTTSEAAQTSRLPNGETVAPPEAAATSSEAVPPSAPAESSPEKGRTLDGPERGVMADAMPKPLLPLAAAPLERPRMAPLFGPPTVAIVPVVGLILDQPPSGFRPGKAAVASVLAERLQMLAQMRSVKTILLMIDSRGGSVTGSERLWTAVTEVMRDKPVVAWLRSFAASGGYYVASAAEHIVASPFTLTGSIGVIAGRPNVVQLAERLGVTSHYYGNPKAGLFTNTLRELSDVELNWLDREIDEAYERFKEVVAMGRRMDVAKVEEVAGGRVWTGLEANELGLVDTLGMFEAAYAISCQLAGIRDPRKAALAWAGPTGSLVDRLLAMRGARESMGMLPPAVTEPLMTYMAFNESPIAYLCPESVFPH